MADISQEISAFLSAVYGEDVRGALVDLANKLNEVVEGVEFAADNCVAASLYKITASYLSSHTELTDYKKLEENKIYQVHADVPASFGLPLQQDGTLIVLQASASSSWKKVYFLFMDNSLYKTTDNLTTGTWHKMDSMFRGTLTPSNSLNAAHDGAWFIPYDSSFPAYWPFSAAGVLLSIGGDGTGRAQYALSGRNNFAYRYYSKSTSTWSDWHYDLNTFKTITNTDDLDNITETCVRYYNSASTAAPANWPISHSGTLVVFGASSNNAPLFRVQTVYGYYGEKVWRIGLSSRWSSWQYEAPDLNSFKMLSATDDIDDIVETCIRFYYPPANEDAQGRHPPVNWPIDSSGSLVVFGSSDTSQTTQNLPLYRIQIIYGYYGENIWRIRLSTGWSEWRPVAHTGRQLNYVAIGPSTTRGSVATYDSQAGKWKTELSSTPEPYWTGLLGNYKVTNLAIGSTDFINRAATSGGPYENYMDVITDPSNQTVLSNADYIAITVGSNDYAIANKSGTGQWWPGSNLNARMTNFFGNSDDYYPYDRSVDWDGPLSQGKLVEYTSSTDWPGGCFYSKVTRAGAINFCIKYISEHFPKAQLVFVLSPLSSLVRGPAAEVRTVHICTTSEYNASTKVPTVASPSDSTVYLVKDDEGSPTKYYEYIYKSSAWRLLAENTYTTGVQNGTKKVAYYVIDAEGRFRFRKRSIELTREICERNSVSIADASATFSTVWNAGVKFGGPADSTVYPADETCRSSHPSERYSNGYYKAITTAIISKLQN